MIETPMVGRFVGEGKRLVIGPPAAYYTFIYIVAGFGAWCLLNSVVPPPLPLWPMWWFMVGASVCAAAYFALQSVQLVVFDLREKTYRRRQGPGLLPRTTHGRLQDLDAIVVTAEPSHAIASTVTYHVVLHWRPDHPAPILVMHSDTRLILPGKPLNENAGPVLKLGASYATALGVKFFDNTYFASPCPVPIWK